MLHKTLITHSTTQSPWQQELASAFRNIGQLLDYLELENNDTNLWHVSDKAGLDFSFLVTRSFAERMRKGDPNDPLLLQVLPTASELITSQGYTENPVGDLEALVAPGLIHKYHGRVLLITTGACPIHCRYCFRRNFPYQHNQSSLRHQRQTLDYIRQHPEITEVILSGGDPLIFTNHRLSQIISELETIPNLKRLRIHSRVPITLPSRIDGELIQLFEQTRLQTIVVTHINHANELDSEAVTESLKELALARVRLLNQSVLLHRINDSVQILADLSEALFDVGIQPYYLHLLDKVSGASHFEISESEALTIYHSMQKQLPGYLVPRLVREVQGMQSKTLLMPT